MKIIEIILFIIALIFSFSWAYGIRTFMRTIKSVTNGTIVTTLFFFISLICVVIFGLSSLHLIWMFIVSWILGQLSMIYPFSLLVIPARYFAAICCIGLSKNGEER
jgi:hypothetical protein